MVTELYPGIQLFFIESYETIISFNYKMTDEQKFRSMAAQLRKPEGEEGIMTAAMLSKGNRHIIHDTFKALNAEAGDNILEIGMGNGFYVKEILEKSESIHYTGCDYSELMVQESEKLNPNSISSGKARFVHAAVTSLPFANNEFDKIFTINTLYFWDNETEALNEIKRVLQPNGKLIIGFRPKHQIEKYPFTKYGFNQFSKADVDKLLSDNGFSIARIFENQEPDIDWNGQIVNMENVVVVASIFPI
jgi:ubiquinone/menaquinone biosynthesis C-methylase UbiE